MYKSSLHRFTFFKNGKDGDDGTVYSIEPPSDTTKLWMDTSTSPPLLKYHNGSEWIIVNQSEIDAIEKRMTSAEQVISNIDGTIQNTCKEIIETDVEERLVSVEEKTSNVTQTTESWTASFKYIERDESGNEKEQSNSIKLSIDGVDVGTEESYSRMAKDKFSIIIEGQESASMSKLRLETDEVVARKRKVLGNVVMVATENGYQERWVGD